MEEQVGQSPTEPAQQGQSAQQGQPGQSAQQAQPGQQPEIRVSDRDRDATAHHLQDAFAEGRLDDEEFDKRMRAALTAKLSSDLVPLTADLPQSSERARPTRSATSGRKPGKFAVAYKNSVRRGGRWRVPERFTTVVYKGNGRLDLRAAELSAQVTTMLAVAYKSRIDVHVPLGVRLELEGFGITKGWSAEEELERLLPDGAPVVRVVGIGYKGTIEVSTKPGEPTAQDKRSLPG